MRESHVSRKTLGTAIREARKNAGLTQQDLAELLEIDREYISRVERDVQTKHLDRLLLILDAVGLDLQAVPKSLGVERVSDSDS